MKPISFPEAVLAASSVHAKIDDLNLQSGQPGSILIQYFPHLTDTMCHSLRFIYISRLEYIIELALFVTSQSGLLSGNPDQFRTILLKKVRFRTKVRENRTIWEHCIRFLVSSLGGPYIPNLSPLLRLEALE